MNEEQLPVLHCMLCAWEGGTTEATYRAESKTGKAWVICEFHAQHKRTQLTKITPLTDFDRKLPFNQKMQESTTRWIQHQRKLGH